MYSTTNAWRQWRHASKKTTWTTNLPPQDNTGKNRQSGLFKHSKPTSSPSWLALMTNYPYRFGATYNRTHLEPPTPIKSSTKNLGICARSLHPWLHAKTFCSNWLCGLNTCQARQPSVMGHKIRARFQPGHIHGTPLIFQGICDKDKSNKDQWHRYIQAPIHNKPNDLIWIPRGGSSATTCHGAPRQHTCRQRNCSGLNQGQQTIHKNCISKEGGHQSKRAEKQTLGKPLGMDYNSLSKGGSTTSKGGRANPKSDQSHSGWLLCSADSCKHVRDATSCASPRDTFLFTVTAGWRAAPSGLAKLHLAGKTMTPLPSNEPQGEQHRA